MNMEHDSDVTTEILFHKEQQPQSPSSDSDSTSSSSSSGESIENGPDPISPDPKSPIVLDDIEEREEESNEMECSSPGSSTIMEPKSLDILEKERVFSCNNPNSRSTAALSTCSKDLWTQFDAIGTEMIVTRRGRRMFPPIKVELFDLNPDSHYVLLMDMAPVDKYRYKYQTSAWVRCFEEECAPTRLYVHPDSPALGSHWMKTVINFYKLKLTNNQLDKQGHIIVNSMHKYQPRLHVVETSDINNLNWENFNTFIFPGTQFTTVTAYQNDRITQLKIENNPFAKGFRSPFSRCRTRNHQRITLRSTGSDSSEDSGMFPSRFFVHPPADYRQESQLVTIVGQKRKAEGADEEQAVKQVCLTTAPTEPGMVKVTTPQLLMSPNPTSLTGPPPVITAVTNQRQHPAQPQSPVLIYVPVVQTATTTAGTVEAHKTLQIHKSINGVSNGINGINCQTLFSNGGQTLSSPRLIQTDQTSIQNLSLSQTGAATVLKPHKYNDVLQVNSSPVVPAVTHTVLPATRTVIQANGQPATVISPASFLNGEYTSPPTQLTTTTVNSPGLSVKLAPNVSSDVKVSEKALSKLSTPTCIDISALTKHSLVRKTSSPPPLVQITPNVKVEDVQKSPIHVTPSTPSPSPPQSSVTILPQSVISEASSPAPSSTTQSVLVQAPATAYTASTQQQQKFYFVTDGKNSQNCVLMPLPNSPTPAIGSTASSAPTSMNVFQSQTQIPIVYDQQIVTPVPVYRFNALNTAVQPIQILTTIPATPQNAMSTVKTV